MAVFGLTGGIGAGKSTVCDMLRDEGITVLAADEVGRQVVAKGSDGLAAIVAHFGPDILDANGALNRGALGRLVFGDPEKRRQLEAIMHPLVKQHSQALFKELARQGASIIVYESALLFETQRQHEMQGTILVTAGEAQRVARVQQRDGHSEADVRARIQAQMGEEEKRRLANYILDNNGDLQDLRRQVQALAATLREVAGVK